MKFPDEKKPGDPVESKDWNLIIQWLRALRIAPGKGYTRKIQPAGTALNILRALRERRFPWGRFRVSVRDNKLFVSPGRVVIFTDGGGLVTPIEPEFEGGKLEDDPPPFWDAEAEAQDGKEYFVLVAFGTELAKVVVHPSDEQLPEEFKRAYVIRVATVVFSFDVRDGETKVSLDRERTVQEWKSDIDICCPDPGFGASSSSEESSGSQFFGFSSSPSSDPDSSQPPGSSGGSGGSSGGSASSSDPSSGGSGGGSSPSGGPGSDPECLELKCTEGSNTVSIILKPDPDDDENWEGSNGGFQYCLIWSHLSQRWVLVIKDSEGNIIGNDQRPPGTGDQDDPVGETFVIDGRTYEVCPDPQISSSGSDPSSGSGPGGGSSGSGTSSGGGGGGSSDPSSASSCEPDPPSYKCFDDLGVQQAVIDMIPNGDGSFFYDDVDYSLDLRFVNGEWCMREYDFTQPGVSFPDSPSNESKNSGVNDPCSLDGSSFEFPDRTYVHCPESSSEPSSSDPSSSGGPGGGSSGVSASSGGGGGGSSDPSEVSSEPSSSEPDSSDPGSGKTAIIPVPGGTNFAAMFAVEGPECRFEHVFQVDLKRRKQMIVMDHRYVVACEPDSIVPTGAVAERPIPIGVEINGSVMTIRRGSWLRKSGKVSFQVSAIRLGFAGVFRPDRTEDQFHQNEKHLKSAYENYRD